jgi:hypothetical protein
MLDFELRYLQVAPVLANEASTVWLLGPISLAGAALSASSVRRPLIMGLVLLFLVYTRVSDLHRPDDWPVSVTQLFMVLAVGVVVYRGPLQRQASLLREPALLALLFYGAVMALSFLHSPARSSDLAPSASTTEVLAQLVRAAADESYLRDLIIVFALVNLLTSIASLHAATWTLLGGAGLLAAAGLVDYATGNDLGGLASRNVTSVADGLYGVRLAGTVKDANGFAQMLVVVLPFAFLHAFAAPRRRIRLLALALLVLVTVATVFTSSRLGFVGLLAVLAMTVVWQRCRPTRLLHVAVVAITIGLAAPPIYWERVGNVVPYVTAALQRIDPSTVIERTMARGEPTTSLLPTTKPTAAGAASSVESPASAEPRAASDPAQAEPARPIRAEAERTPAAVANVVAPTNSARPSIPNDDGSLYLRSLQLRVAFQIFLDHPLLGVGRGSYYTAYPLYFRKVDPLLPSEPKGPHNALVHIAAETGLLGLAAYLGVVVATVLSLHDARQRFRRHGLESAVLMLGSIEIAIYTYLVTVLFLNDDIYQRLLWLLVGLSVVGRQLSLRFAEPGPTTPAAPTPAAAPAGIGA